MSEPVSPFIFGFAMGAAITWSPCTHKQRIDELERQLADTEAQLAEAEQACASLQIEARRLQALEDHCEAQQ